MIFYKKDKNGILITLSLIVSLLPIFFSSETKTNEFNKANTELSRLIEQKILPLQLVYYPELPRKRVQEKKHLRSLGDYFLEKAIRAENSKAVKILLEAGVDPRVIFYDYEEDSPSSLLHVAVRTGNVSIVSLLLKYGADINSSVALYGNTPLMVAIEEDDEKMVRKLINSGADVHYRSNRAPSEEDATPLNLAMARRDNDIIQLLKDAGATNVQTADIDMQDVSIGLKRPREVSEGDDQTREKKRIRRDEQEDDMDVSDDTSDDDTTLDVLIRQGVIPLDPTETTTGEIVADFGSAETHDKEDSIGEYILYNSVNVGNTDAVTVLLRAGMSPDSTLWDQEEGVGMFSVLHRAALNNDISMVRLLLSQGADINNSTFPGSLTPLQVLVGVGYGAEIIKLLIDKKADVNKIYEEYDDDDLEGRTILSIAINNYLENNPDFYQPVILWLINARADLNESLFGFVSDDDYLEHVDVAIRFGADLNSRNEDGEVPLIVAAKKNQNEVVELLLSRGAIPPTEQEMVAHGLSEESKALIRKNKHLYYEYTDAVEEYLDKTIAHQDIHNEVLEDLLGEKEAKNIRKRKEWTKQFKQRFPGLENMLEKISSEEQISAFIEAFGRTVRKMKQQQK